MTVQQYFEKINKRFQSGISTEHGYRGDLQLLLETLCPFEDIMHYQKIIVALTETDRIMKVIEKIHFE